MQNVIEVTKRENPFVPSNEEHSTVMTPYEIPWESLTHSNTWNFTQLALPKPIQNRKPLFIMQDDKGNVTIQFPKEKKDKVVESLFKEVELPLLLNNLSR